jgi:large subunit ribosomal protein L10
MPLTRERRLQSIEKLQKDFGEAKGIYLTDFSGINVGKINRFRRSLRTAGARYVVVKNSLARKALEKCGKAELSPYFKGPVGVALTANDSVAPARVIREFRKDNKNLLGVRIVYVDGALFNEEQMTLLADLPSREILLSQFLSCLQAPMSKMVGALGGIFTKFVGTLEAVRQKKESVQ